MATYLGETRVAVEDTPYKDYTRLDWAQYWIESGQCDGGHHKQWAMDQAMRAIKGTGVEIDLAKWDNGEENYRVSTVEPPSDEYLKWVDMMKGELLIEDGYEQYEYDYDEGIAP